ncbi:MAG: flippase-like domain-containing protein [Chthoniobacterales bacterium]
MKPALRFLVVALGLALFGWFVHRAGVGEIARAFSNLGWFAPIALLPFALVYLLDTLGWRLAFGPAGLEKIGFRMLARIRWAGESINSVLASVYVGGEAVKVHLLQKRGVPTMNAASSVVAGKTAQVLAQVVFLGIGSFAGAANLPADSPVRAGMLAVTGAAVAIVGLLFWLQNRGMFSSLLWLTERLRLNIRALATRAESLRRLDQRIFDFYRHDHRHFILSTLAYLGGWMADTLEILLVSHLLGMPVEWSQALAVEAFISVAKAVGIFVPGALGVQESGIVFLFYLFGLPPALAVSYAVIRRGREVVYALVGGAFLYADGLSLRPRDVPEVKVA